MTPRFRRKETIKNMITELRSLRAKHVEQGLLLKAKDEALSSYVDERIQRWNQAIRLTGGIRRGEPKESYRQRLVEANSRPFVWRGGVHNELLSNEEGGNEHL